MAICYVSHIDTVGESIKSDNVVDTGVSKNERLVWADILKGIAITLVVIGHNLSNPSIPFQFIYSFHMPLFFFISGFFFKKKYCFDLKNLLIKKIKTLLLPYYLYGLASVILYCTLVDGNFLLLDVLMFGNRMEMTNAAFNTALWFLPCLFMVTMIFAVLYRVLKQYSVIPIFIMSIITYSTINDPQWIYTTDSAFYYLFFFTLGFFLSSYDRIKSCIVTKREAICIVIAISVLLSQLIMPEIDNYCFRVCYSIVVAFSGIIVFGYLSKLIALSTTIISKIFCFLGVNSLIVMIFHVPVREYLLGCFDRHWTILAQTEWVLRGFNMIGSLLLCIPFILIINKRYAWTIGKG